MVDEGGRSASQTVAMDDGGGRSEIWRRWVAVTVTTEDKDELEILFIAEYRLKVKFQRLGVHDNAISIVFHCPSSPLRSIFSPAKHQQWRQSTVARAADPTSTFTPSTSSLQTSTSRPATKALSLSLSSTPPNSPSSQRTSSNPSSRPSITGEFSARGPRSTAIAVALSSVTSTMMVLLSPTAQASFTLALVKPSLGLPGIDSRLKLFGFLLRLDQIVMGFSIGREELRIILSIMKKKYHEILQEDFLSFD
ncbi:hypothetical protein TEA_017414 [Camellia sinensis var. sinensis]|uniref:Uncharacterized protein n=1 Tax=Camellia sinensis var. sinensis TaxID=542762 RepID=A0A4S4E7K2_CAMSN|nr:hypothetical protein TEA_017414 [Camellia sinensis var. sinensis]